MRQDSPKVWSEPICSIYKPELVCMCHNILPSSYSRVCCWRKVRQQNQSWLSLPRCYKWREMQITKNKYNVLDWHFFGDTRLIIFISLWWLQTVAIWLFRPVEPHQCSAESVASWAREFMASLDTLHLWTSLNISRWKKKKERPRQQQKKKKSR